MSPASKSKTKSKEKSSARSTKEQQKASIKTSGSTNTITGSQTSAYNPISGTFHMLEMLASASSPPFHDNSCVKNIDDDEHSSSPHATASEYDSVSNNGSCSGESEDPKEKVMSCTRQETVPGSDNDRREKIRLKNEKKHQRQRERRAQELHERCTGYLMSRKLEGHSQLLVAMGFSHERATLALMLNNGQLEESVNWLFEGSEEDAHNKEAKNETTGNLNIDISEELAQISAMEVRYKCSKQEVERAVVACEGDLVKAEESLCAQKREPPATPPISEDISDIKNLKRVQEMPASASSVTTQQRSERDFNHAKTAGAVSTYSETGSGNLQSLNQSKSLADKRWATTVSSPSFSPAISLPRQATPPPAKLEVWHGVSVNELKNAQQVVREPVAMIQRPKSVNAKQNPDTSVTAIPSGTAGWHSSNAPVVQHIGSNGRLFPNHITSTFGLANQSSEQFYHPTSYKEAPFLYSAPVDSPTAGLGCSWSTMGKSRSVVVPSELQGSHIRMGASFPPLAAPSSLGLFTGLGTSGALGSSSHSSHVDWSTTGGMMPEFDYTSIDWTLDSNQVSSKSSELWMGLSSILRNSSGMRMGSADGSYMPGLRENGVTKETSSSAGVGEWTSPFAGKDMFSVPRQFVTSPSPWG